MSDPIIKMEENGQASVINYNVPEPTSYAGTFVMEIDFDDAWFTDEAKAIPEGRQEEISDDEYEAAFDKATENGVVDTRIFPNISTGKSASNLKITSKIVSREG